MKRVGQILWLAVVVAVVACTGGTGAASPTGSVAPARTGTPSPASSVTVPAAVLDPVLDDAATRTGAPRDSISVSEAEAMTWTTGALGCPTPGVMYTQALVDGWRVIVLAGTKRIDYRVSGPGRFRVCESLAGS